MTFSAIQSAKDFLGSDKGVTLQVVVDCLATTRVQTDKLLLYVSNVYSVDTDSFINGYDTVLTANEQAYIRAVCKKIKEVCDLSDQLSAGA